MLPAMLPELSPLEILLWAGLVIGLAFGITGQMTGFCLTRGLREYWLPGEISKSGTPPGAKLGAFALAMAIAVVGAQLLDFFGVIDLRRSLYLAPGFPLLLVPLGGVLFGFGMMLANGCGARALVLLGQGNLRSFVVLLCLGISAYATLTGLLAPLRNQAASLAMAPTVSALDLSANARLATVALVSLVCALFAFWRARLAQHPRDLIGGLVVGLLIVAGWLATGWLAQDDFEPKPVSSLTFIAPIGETIQYSMIATGVKPGFGVMLVAGVFLGALLAALIRRRTQLEGFATPRDMLRYMAGGTLMGIGGALAMGCSIGQGLTGFSTLAFSSLLACLGIVVGARLALPGVARRLQKSSSAMKAAQAS